MARRSDKQPAPRSPDEQRILDVLLPSRVSRDLLEAIGAATPGQKLDGAPAARARRHPVIIELNNNYPGGARRARADLVGIYIANHPIRVPQQLQSSREAELLALTYVGAATAETGGFEFSLADTLNLQTSSFTENYLFGELTADTIVRLAGVQNERRVSPVYKIWLDPETHAFAFESVKTIKCDAARAAFGAHGEGIIWAVADTGIQGDHPHFVTHASLSLPEGVAHQDFTEGHDTTEASAAAALVDPDGHGSHVAGIIAGGAQVGAKGTKGGVREIRIERRRRKLDDDGDEVVTDTRSQISGIAPLCKLMSLKVLKDRRRGRASGLMAAIGYVQQLNEHGRNIRVHGLNLSLGYSFDPEWFAAGQSPLCNEVNRLVKAGVVVVAAAGNGGYGVVTTQSGRAETAAHGCTIADPGNAEYAITVGSTHRNMPHHYGVSYFSAKGPTADGRPKPDLVAPGERIISCAPPEKGRTRSVAAYREDSGTSMAAPHVSAAVAAFLSIRREFIGHPEKVKALMLANATDLKRDREFQGAGLIDLMRALQAV